MLHKVGQIPNIGNTEQRSEMSTNYRSLFGQMGVQWFTCTEQNRALS